MLIESETAFGQSAFVLSAELVFQMQATSISTAIESGNNKLSYCWGPPPQHTLNGAGGDSLSLNRP